jgi:hypothetical protein
MLIMRFRTTNVLRSIPREGVEPQANLNTGRLLPMTLRSSGTILDFCHQESISS